MLSVNVLQAVHYEYFATWLIMFPLYVGLKKSICCCELEVKGYGLQTYYYFLFCYLQTAEDLL